MKKIILSLLVVLAAVMVAVVLFDRKPENLHEAKLEKKQDSDDWWITEEKYGSPGENNLWRMSANILMFSAPHEYNVAQSDAEGISAVTVSEDYNDTDALSFYIISSRSFDGLPLSKEDILATILLEDVAQRTNCAVKIIDGVTMDCYQGMLEGKAITMYIGQLDESHYASIYRAYDTHEGLDLVLDSTNWNPTENEMVGSIIIP